MGAIPPTQWPPKLSGSDAWTYFVWKTSWWCGCSGLEMWIVRMLSDLRGFRLRPLSILAPCLWEQRPGFLWYATTPFLGPGRGSVELTPVCTASTLHPLRAHRAALGWLPAQPSPIREHSGALAIASAKKCVFPDTCWRLPEGENLTVRPAWTRPDWSW